MKDIDYEILRSKLGDIYNIAYLSLTLNVILVFLILVILIIQFI